MQIIRLRNPLVSVVMPAYNAEKFIEESISSVILQTYTNWELLIVDDGSVDKTKEIIKDFISKDSRIKYYYQPNGRQGKARNLALKHAAGVYVAFLDADDIWLPEKLEKQLKQVITKNIDLVFSDAYIFSKKISERISTLNSGKGFFEGNVGLRDFLELNKIPTLTVLTKKEIIDAVDGFTESPAIPQAEDYHLWLKLLMNNYRFYGSEEVLAGYRVDDETISKDKLFVPRVIEAFEDLKNSYKPYKQIITCYQKKWFKRYHYSTSDWSKVNYKRLIKQNCIYLNKRNYDFFLQKLYYFFGLRLTRKLINRFINNVPAL